MFKMKSSINQILKTYRKPHRQKVSTEFEDKFDKQEHWYQEEGGEITVKRTCKTSEHEKKTKPRYLCIRTRQVTE